jgi:hypothetical protein
MFYNCFLNQDAYFIRYLNDTQVMRMISVLAELLQMGKSRRLDFFCIFYQLNSDKSD